jgi:hypothetical protein
VLWHRACQIIFTKNKEKDDDALSYNSACGAVAVAEVTRADFCWCDPITEVDETGDEVVLHRQATWN